MYAVIISGGKQYRVKEGDVLKVESLQEDIGSKLKFEQILMIGEGESARFGKPFIDGCSVSATVVAKGRHKKIHIVKFRRRKHHEKWQGHRQNYTEIKIEKIKA